MDRLKWGTRFQNKSKVETAQLDANSNAIENNCSLSNLPWLILVPKKKKKKVFLNAWKTQTPKCNNKFNNLFPILLVPREKLCVRRGLSCLSTALCAGSPPAPLKGWFGGKPHSVTFTCLSQSTKTTGRNIQNYLGSISMGYISHGCSYSTFRSCSESHWLRLWF